MATAIEELLGLLAATSGEPTGSLHSAIGRWRQRVSLSLGAAIVQLQQVADQQSHPPQAATQTFVQTEMSSEGAGQVLGSGTTVLFDGDPYGDISYNPATGFFRLLPGRNYRLTAHFALGNYSGEGNNVTIDWVDAVTNAVLHDGHGALCTSGGNPASINANPTADTFHQVSGTVQDVKLRVTTLGSATALPGACSALVQEI
jgi:hypothetical protein